MIYLKNKKNGMFFAGFDGYGAIWVNNILNGAKAYGTKIDAAEDVIKIFGVDLEYYNYPSEEEKEQKNMTYFPIKIQETDSGKAYIVKSPENLPIGIGFKVIETNVIDMNDHVDEYLRTTENPRTNENISGDNKECGHPCCGIDGWCEL